MLKVAEKEISAVTGDRVQLTENSGQKLRHLIVQSNPWKGGKCQNHTSCWVCSNPYNKVSNGDLRSVTYSSYCLLCRDKAEAEAAGSGDTETAATEAASTDAVSTATDAVSTGAATDAASTGTASIVDPASLTGSASLKGSANDAADKETKVKKKPAIFKQYYGESHRTMCGGPGGEGGRATEHARDYRAKLDTSHAWKHVSTEHPGLEPDQVPWGITVLNQHPRGPMHRMLTECVLIYRGGKNVYNSRSEYSRTQVPRLCAMFDENLQNQKKPEDNKEEIDLEEENKKVRHKRKDYKEAASQPQHSQERKKQKVAHKSNPGKFPLIRKAEDEPSNSKVKTSKKVKNLTEEGETEDNNSKLGANSNYNVDNDRESPTAKDPPDPPKPAKATPKTRLKTIPLKGKKQTSMFNFISRSSDSKGQASSSRETGSNPHHRPQYTQLTQDFNTK